MTTRSAQEQRVAAALVELVALYGRDRLREPALVRGALGDALGAEATALRRELELVVRAVAEGVLDGMPGEDPGAAGTVVARLVALAVDPAAAHWAVAAWARALGGSAATFRGPGEQPVAWPSGDRPTVQMSSPPVAIPSDGLPPRRSGAARVVAAGVAALLVLLLGVGAYAVVEGRSGPTNVAGPETPPAPSPEPTQSAEPDPEPVPDLGDTLASPESIGGSALGPAQSTRMFLELCAGANPATAPTGAERQFSGAGVSAVNEHRRYDSAATAQAEFRRLQSGLSCTSFPVAMTGYPAAKATVSVGDAGTYDGHPVQTFTIAVDCGCPTNSTTRKSFEEVWVVYRVGDSLGMFGFSRDPGLAVGDLADVREAALSALRALAAQVEA